MVKAELKNYRQSPRKVRSVANLVRGKKVSDAITTLMFASKKASEPIIKLLNSAVANAKNNFGLSTENLYVKEIRVDQGIVMKRFLPKARGSASPLRKKMSRVLVVLAEKGGKEVKAIEKTVKTVAKTEKPKAKKTVKSTKK